MTARTHHYVRPADRPGVPWPQSDPPCGSCGLGRSNVVHVVPEVSEDARRLAARMQGEGEREVPADG